MFTTVIAVLIVIVCVLLALVVLIQNPQEGGLTAGFGSAFSSQFVGIQQAADFLEKATWVLVGILVALVLLFNIVLYSGMGQEAGTPPLPAAPETTQLPVQQ